MKCLYPEDAEISASFSFRDPALLPKSIHFKTLTELNISENKVDSLFDLMGIACLGSLKRLMVQGNPIMKQFKPLHQLSRRGQEASKRGLF
jgi:Leucine-rich repeat (LRR) protein